MLSDFHDTSYVGRVSVKVGCYLISDQSTVQYGHQVAILENYLIALQPALGPVFLRLLSFVDTVL